MVKKIKKFRKIFKSVIKQNKEISRIKSYDNSLLNSVLAAFLKVKDKRFEESEEEKFKSLEKFRHRLNEDQTVITYEIFDSDLKRTVEEISKKGPSSPLWCKFHYCLAKELNSQKYLEIGTNLGISGSYILSAIKERKDSQFVTMEGVKKLCEIAESQFVDLADKGRFEIVPGLYDETFPVVLQMDTKFDSVFIDGNHKAGPTLFYFNALKPKLGDKAVIVFDDINWSREMQEAWEVIKLDPKVNYSIDLYKLGIVVIDQDDKNKNIAFDLFLGL